MLRPHPTGRPGGVTISALDRDATVYVAGHRGLVGSAVVRHLEAQGFTDVVGRTSAEVDLRDRDAAFGLLEELRPAVLVMAAARVGGIMANSTFPAEFLSDNLRVQVNILDAAQQFGVEKLLFLGSSCIYPRLAPQPIRENALMSGPLEPTNDAYAIAKIAGILQVQALRREYGRPYISAMPTNLYGPHDNFDEQSSHVLPAMIRRFEKATREAVPEVTIWGSGTPRREFMHVDDLARACLFLLEHYDEGDAINVGTGTDVTIAELASLVADAVGYQGTLAYDHTKPDGMPRKLLDVSRIEALGWRAEVDLATGVKETVAWYRENVVPA